MERMSLAIDNALKEVRRLVSALCPRVLDDLGLGPAIEWLVGEFTDQSGIACRLKMDAMPNRIPRATATAAFRCIQECLTNIGHHATATLVIITVRHDRHLLSLAIADNDRTAAHSRTTANSFVHLGVRQRAELHGGNMKIRNRHGRGTRIEIALPLLPQEDRSGVQRGATALKGKS